MTRLGTEPWSPRPLESIHSTRPMDRCLFSFQKRWIIVLLLCTYSFRTDDPIFERYDNNFPVIVFYGLLQVPVVSIYLSILSNRTDRLIYIYIYIHTRTHTHTHIYIYIWTSPEELRRLTVTQILEKNHLDMDRLLKAI